MGCNTSQEQNAAPTDENNHDGTANGNGKSNASAVENGKVDGSRDKLTNGHTVDDAKISEGNLHLQNILQSHE